MTAHSDISEFARAHATEVVHEEPFTPVGGRLITPWTIFLTLLAAIAGVILVDRLMHGLGAVTNINDGFPWGIWIAYDVVIGTAFACGGYAMALLCYIFNKGEYHPLVRPALLASAFGYTLGGASVIIDLGRWWNAWHIFTPGFAQTNSVMFEVAICVACYICVLWIEFTPVFLERLGLKNIKHKLNKIIFFFVALGVLLPTMHQSSLGSLLVVMGYQIHPLWQSPILPLLFLTSSMTMGFSIVIFEAVIAGRNFGRPVETSLLAKVAFVMRGMLSLFVAIRLIDLAVRGDLGLAFRGDLRGDMFLIEMLLFILPIFMLGKRRRTSLRALFVAATSMLLAGALYRVDAYLVGYLTGPGWNYFPSWTELMLTVGIIAAEVLGYIVFVRLLPVLHAAPKTAAAAH
jgi:Ni/Fe-hydrogenase subunit HybB-like protein